MEFRELSDVLWRERQLLDLLSYKLEAESLVASSEPRWLAQATREVTLAVERVRLAEIERATVSADVAISCGLQPLSSLREIAEIAPDPWSGILDRHREALTALTSSINEAAARSSSRLAQVLSEARAVVEMRGSPTRDGV